MMNEPGVLIIGGRPGQACKIKAKIQPITRAKVGRFNRDPFIHWASNSTHSFMSDIQLIQNQLG